MRSLLAKILHRGMNSIPGVRFRLWNEYRCDMESMGGQPDPGVEPRKISPAMLQELQVIKPEIADPQNLAERFELGNECWVVDQDGQPVYSQWVMVNHTEEPLALWKSSRAPARFYLPPHALYFWDAWCHPAFRGRGINRKAKAYIMSRHHAQGIEQAVTIILPFNQANLRSVAALGFRYQRWLIEFRYSGLKTH